jgi:hypothetical protein
MPRSLSQHRRKTKADDAKKSEGGANDTKVPK